ncbi:hypothetical protein [Sphingomonas aquatilis]|uniref:hypothetical protein n=1 Tax=Sphingomonas aquatilis TaxID=93063 RepID=UPI0023F7F95B|nr:hypothetical protein [Sphingomonas aquatilis]MCI4655428.1 hypothetical protein [Sphingomonas aquatilis]
MTKYSPSRQCAFLGRAYRRAVAGVLRFDDAAGERDFILVSFLERGHAVVTIWIRVGIIHAKPWGSPNGAVDDRGGPTRSFGGDRMSRAAKTRCSSLLAIAKVSGTMLPISVNAGAGRRVSGRTSVDGVLRLSLGDQLGVASGHVEVDAAAVAVWRAIGERAFLALAVDVKLGFGMSRHEGLPH